MARIWVGCPKCSSENAWYEIDSQKTVLLRCLCGYCKVVETVSEEAVITHPEVGSPLPRRDTKLFRCLAMLVGLREATTAQIAEQLNAEGGPRQSNSDIASQLTVLRYKGFVVSVEDRKGFPGGSTWRPTDAATSKLAKEC